MIHIRLPFLPPTLNHMYENIPKRRIGKKMIGGGRRLTNAGKEFKLNVSQVVLRNHAMETGQLGPISGIGLYVAFGFPNLLNKGYPEKSESRYKKLDVSNRLKALEDGLTETINFDDSQIIFSVSTKHLSKSEESLIWLWNEEQELIGARLTQSFSSFAGLTA